MIEGFTVGIAVIIFLQQVPAALGVAKPEGENTAAVAVRAVGDAFSGDGSAAARRRWSRWSSAVMVVAARIASVAAGVAARRGGRDGRRRGRRSRRRRASGRCPARCRLPSLPDDVELAEVSDLLSAGVRGRRRWPRSRACCRRRSPTAWPTSARHDPDRELFGQGLANIVSPLFGGMPATGAIARTAVNVRAGARTRVAAVDPRASCSSLVVLFARRRWSPRSRSPRWPGC